MPDAKHRDIDARTPDGGVQLAASTDRWHLFDAAIPGVQRAVEAAHAHGM